MSTEPGGDAMTTRYQRGTDPAALKRETVPLPQAWRIRQTEITRLTADGKHCETRKCRELVAIVSWRWWRSAEAGRVLLTEHFVCTEHGQQFAVRRHIQIEPPADQPRSISRGGSR